MNILKNLFIREVQLILHHPIYPICMVAVPLCLALFFTTLLDEGQPTNMPIGIVDLDNTSTTRRLTRMIDGFQSTEVVAHYPSVNEARHAMQKNEVYGFILFPEHLTSNLLSARSPKISFYYSNTSLTAGSLVYKEMKTVSTLGMAGTVSGMLTSLGLPPHVIKPLLQPVALDTHNIGNPWVNYNIYLSTMLIPASFLLFIFLITAYSLGAELKFNTSKELLDMAGGSIIKAVFAKLFVQHIIFTGTLLLIYVYLFGYLHFPAPGGIWRLILLAVLSVSAAQGVGASLFGLLPSMRLAMSISSLWGVLSFSMVGSAFPVFAMDSPLQGVAPLFPMRHYYLIYQLCIFNNYPLSDVAPYLLCMLLFTLLPLLVLKRIKTAYLTYDYMS